MKKIVMTMVALLTMTTAMAQNNENGQRRGFQRHNYAHFYEKNMNGYGIKRGSTDITNLEKFERIINGTYDEYKAKQQEILNFNVNKAQDNLRYRDYILGMEVSRLH